MGRLSHLLHLNVSLNVILENEHQVCNPQPSLHKLMLWNGNKKSQHFRSKALFYDPTLLCVLNHKCVSKTSWFTLSALDNSRLFVCPHLEFSQSLLIWHWKRFSLNTRIFPSLFSTSRLIFLHSYIKKKQKKKRVASDLEFIGDAKQNKLGSHTHIYEKAGWDYKVVEL